MVSHETCNFNCKKQVATSSLQPATHTVSNGFRHKFSLPLKSYKNRLFARKKTRYTFNGFPPKAHLPLKGSKKQAKNLVASRRQQRFAVEEATSPKSHRNLLQHTCTSHIKTPRGSRATREPRGLTSSGQKTYQ